MTEKPDELRRDWLLWPDEIVIRISTRGDGGLRVCSDTLPRLILSHANPEQAMAAVLPSIDALLAHGAAPKAKP